MSEIGTEPVAGVEIIGRDSPEHRFSSRSIRSFVLRQGRMSEAQQRYLDDMLPKIGIDYRVAPLDLDEAFGRKGPKILEIGFGMGETTAAIAQAHPERDYVGIEVHTPGVGALLRHVESLGLTNVRVIQHDAVEVVEWMIAPGALDGVHVFFPDPWPKKRHHKRRIVQPAFVELIARKLRPGGVFRLATDWQDYAGHMLAVVGASDKFHNQSPAGGYVPRPGSRPLTRFEQRGQRLGHQVWDLAFSRP